MDKLCSARSITILPDINSKIVKLDGKDFYQSKIKELVQGKYLMLVARELKNAIIRKYTVVKLVLILKEKKMD